MSLRRALIAFTLALACAWVACALIPRPRLAEAVLPAPARVYARPLVLAQGLRISLDAITSHLMRAGYRRASAKPEPGEYRVRGRTLDVALRPFRFPDGEDAGGAVSITLDAAGKLASLTAPDGRARDVVAIEPELLGVLFGARAQDRVMLPLEKIPRHVVDAVLAVEDRRFYFHPGVDLIRIAGALAENLRERRVSQGASTLTQQLVKNVYLSPERTLARKLREVVYALWIEARYSKQEILEAYLNQVYLGQTRGVGIHGFGRAARFYFGKELADVSVAEAALLAGMIQAPNALSPFRHPEKARARRDVVLALMREQEKLGAERFAQATAAPLGVRSEQPLIPFAAHFVDFVRERVVEALGEEAVEDGLDVFTTLDGNMQRAAENALREGLRALERGYPKLRRAKSPLEAALVAVDPQTGDVLALVGGRDFVRSPFNRAVLARRGSSARRGGSSRGI